MFRLLFAVYVVVEIAALWAVAATIGVGWAILLVMIGSALGVIAFGAQSRRLVESLAGRTDRPRGRAPSMGRSLADGSLSMTAVALLLTPGLVTSALGVLLLFPPTRIALRPVVMRLGLRHVSAAVGSVDAAARRPRSARGDVIDGEVVDDDPGANAADPAGPAGATARTPHGDLFPHVLPPSSRPGTR